jgi:hypothetical protein
VEEDYQSNISAASIFYRKRFQQNRNIKAYTSNVRSLLFSARIACRERVHAVAQHTRTGSLGRRFGVYVNTPDHLLS